MTCLSIVLHAVLDCALSPLKLLALIAIERLLSSNAGVSSIQPAAAISSSCSRGSRAYLGTD